MKLLKSFEMHFPTQQPGTELALVISMEKKESRRVLRVNWESVESSRSLSASVVSNGIDFSERKRSSVKDFLEEQGRT